MKLGNSHHRGMIYISGALLAGVLVGGGVMAAATETVNSKAPAESNGAEDPGYVTPTFASEFVEIETDDGKPGYAFAADLVWEEASNPAEAAAIMKERVEPDGRVLIPVYAGKSREELIGYFTAGTVNIRESE